MSYLCEGLDVIVVLEAHHIAASLRVQKKFLFFASFFPRSLLLLFNKQRERERERAFIQEGSRAPVHHLLFFSFLFLPPLHYIIALRLSLSSVPLGLPLWASLSAFSVLVIHTLPLRQRERERERSFISFEEPNPTAVVAQRNRSSAVPPHMVTRRTRNS